MRQVIYCMQFTGRATPADGSPGVLVAATTAPSCTIGTSVGSDGVDGTFRPANGGDAAFESVVTFTSETNFQESGTISFGDDGHRLRFSTVGQGSITPSADPRLAHGSVSWRVDEGSRQFAGATGLITSNFTVSDTGDVTDHHFGLIFVV